jgi:16S rRNA (guanine527-N7)-methyltransferase
MTAPLSREAAGVLLGVSRETLDRLQSYIDLLLRWQDRINLVGPATLADVWRRHIVDSVQLWPQWPADARSLVDLGSGAGLPGLLLAVMGAPIVHLIESDRRKAAFLREAARACGAAVQVHAQRIQAVPPLNADVITARALAPLDELLPLALPHMHHGTTLLLLKGRGAASELTRAQEHWTMDATSLPSLSDPEGQILIIRDVRRAPSRGA